MKREPWKRGEIGFLSAALLAVVFLVVAGRTLQKRAERPVVAIAAPLPTPAPNGIDLYSSAALATVRSRPEVDPSSDPQSHTLSPAQKAQRYSRARRRAWVNANAPTWRLLAQARAAESQQEQTRGWAALNALFPAFARQRQLARDIAARTNWLKMEGRWADAEHSSLDGVEMGHDIARGGPLIAGLVSVAIGAISMTSLGDVPQHLSAAEAQIAARRLEKLIAERPRASDVLREEKAASQSIWLVMWGTPPEEMNRVQAFLWDEQAAFREFDRTADIAIKNADLPAKKRAVVPPLVHESHYSGEIFARATGNFDRAHAIEALHLMRLALRAFRLENGAYPTQLSQLTPKYLATIPLDPYGAGETLRYKKIGDSYRVWSIGPDGKNDGGAPLKRAAGSAPFSNGRVFIDFEATGDAVATPESPLLADKAPEINSPPPV